MPQTYAQNQPIQIWAIPCRWCNHYVFPKIIDGTITYPKACSNRTCKRTTYKSSDREIQEMKDYRMSFLKYNRQKKRKYAEIIPAERLVCFICDIVHRTPEALNRHNQRRHAEQ
jgi:hypothetical protein